MSRVSLVALGVVVAIGLTGCIDDRGSMAEIPGYPGAPSVDAAPLPIVTSDTAVVGVGFADSTLYVTTDGVRDCPWVPRLRGIDDVERSVEIAIELLAEGAACSAVGEVRTFELPTDRDLTGYSVEVAVP